MTIARLFTSGPVRRAGASGLRVLVVGLLLTAVAATLVRVVLPLTRADNRWVAEWLGAHLGYQVRFGDAAFGLRGLTPYLRVQDIRLVGADGDAAHVLALDAMDVALDPLASLDAGSPRIEALTLIGARLAVRIDASGRFRLDGLEAVSGEDPRMLSFLLTQARVELVIGELSVRDERPGAPLAGIVLRDLRLQLHNDRDLHRLTAVAVPRPLAAPAGADAAPSPARELRLIAELAGPSDDPSTWTGRAYARLATSRLGPLPGPFGRVEQAALEGWVRISGGRPEQLLVRLDLEGMALAGSGTTPDGATGPALDHLSALARVVPHGDGWRLELADLAGRLAAQPLPALRLDLRLDSGLRPERLDLATEPLDLARLAEWVRTAAALVPERVLPEPVERWLGAKPRGHLDGLAVGVQWGPGGAPRWAATGTLRDLGWDAVDRLPGVEGLDARVRADSRGGEARVAASNVALDLAPVFDRGIALDRLAARLYWGFEPDGGLVVSGRNLSLENADLGARARFRLRLPPAGASPELDLRASFYDGDGLQTRTYLPVGLMHPELVRWLERALVAGRAPQADLVLRGPLAAYPFRGHEGRFELLMELDELVLDYVPGWPAIRAAEGRLHFLDSSLSIELDRGRLYESRLTRAQARIDELRGVEGIRITGAVEGPFADGLRALGETPLATRLGRLAEVLEVTGDSRLQLEIEVPFVKGRSTAVAGRLSWPAPAALAVRDTPLRIEDLAGEVRFTEDRIAADGLTGRLWGAPLRAAIETVAPGEPDESRTRIKAWSRTPVEGGLAERFPSPVWRAVSGALDWGLELGFRNREMAAIAPSLDYRLWSELRGLAIDLPAPLGKPAAREGELILAGTLIPGRALQVAGRLGALAADLRLDPGTPPDLPVRAHLRLGDEPAPLPAGDGLFVDGRLAELDPAAWLAALDRMRIGTASTAPPRAPKGRAWLSGVALDVGRVAFGPARLTDVAVRLAPVEGTAGDAGWDLDINARELAGRVRVPAGADRPWILGLDRLDLLALREARPVPASSGAVSGPPAVSEFLLPERFPPLDARIAGLTLGALPLGTLELGVRPGPGSLDLSPIRLSGGPIDGAGNAVWRKAGDAGRSELSVRIAAGDTGSLLATLGSRSRLEAAPLEASVALDWPGGFEDFALVRASGVADIQVGPGRLLEVEPGLGRLLGVLNLDAAKRRLAMDFSDLYGEGFAFEEMRGRVRIRDGEADFDDFTIEGPASKVIVKGTSDLATQRLDQDLVVEPRLGSSVALASAVAGGPVVGAAVYLVDRIAGNAIDRLGRYRYRVTGSWTDPAVEPVGWDPAVGPAVDPPVDPAEMPAEAPRPNPTPNHFLE